MRVVADTNVVVSGLLWKGVPSRILEAAEAGDIRLFSSGSLLEELEGVLQREKFSKKLSEVALDAVAVVQRYRDGISIVVPASLGPVITDDPQMTMRYSPVRWPPGPRRSSLVSTPHRLGKLRRNSDLDTRRVAPAAGLDLKGCRAVRHDILHDFARVLELQPGR